MQVKCIGDTKPKETDADDMMKREDKNGEWVKGGKMRKRPRGIRGGSVFCCFWSKPNQPKVPPLLSHPKKPTLKVKA